MAYEFFIMNESSPNPASNLTHHASKAVFWSMGGNIGVSAISFIGTMIIARILAPEEFGIIGMAMLFTELIAIFGNLGMTGALIQLKETDEEFKSTAFWTNMICAAALFIVSLLTAPLAAKFFNQPDVQPVLMVLASMYIFSALAITHASLLYKELRFKEMAVIEIISSLVRIFLIVLLALAGFGFWSLVWGTVLERIFKTILIVNCHSWRPKFLFSKEKFDRLFHFGRNIYGQSFVNYFSNNIDFIITGKILGPQSLAFYQFAYNLPHLVLSHVSAGIENVSFPVFSKLQDERTRLARGFLKSVKYISIVTFPLMAGLAFVAKDFMTTMYGAQWAPAILPLQILCLSGAIRSVTVTIHPVLQAIGRPDITLKYTLALMPIVVVLIIFLSRWGVEGVALGMVGTSFLYLAVVRTGAHQIGTRLRVFFKSLIPSVVCSLLMVAVLFAIGRIPSMDRLFGLVRLAVNVLAGGGVYTGILWLLFRNDFNDLLAFARGMFFKSKI